MDEPARQTFDANAKQLRIDNLRNSVKLLTAKVELWKQKHRAAVEKGKREREFINAVSTASLFVGQRDIAKDYLEAHKSFSDADENLMLVQVAEFNSQLAVHQAMLEELDPAAKIQSPGKVILT